METNTTTFKLKYFLASIIIVVVLLFISYLYFNKPDIGTENQIEKKHTDAYYSSLLGNDPVALQKIFVENIKEGINDKYTKADAYFITHRYFDNGGNIYEIFNYINRNPELSFLKEAENIYPDIFKQIKDEKLAPFFTDRSTYAYLAYLEVMYKYGYTDIAAIGTSANQYAKTAYFSKTIAKEMTAEGGAFRSFYSDRDVKKSLEFISLANDTVSSIMDGKITSEDVVPRDILVGLNQYAASLRYLEALGIIATSTKNSQEIFSFTMDYSNKYVKELVLFTSLLNASTLVILPTSTELEIKTALYPVLDLDLKKVRLMETSIIHKVLNSRLEVKPKYIGGTSLDIYSKRNITKLASKVPDFKKWLEINGWTESDFLN